MDDEIDPRAEAQYNNRALVADSGAIIARWGQDAAAFRDAWPRIEAGLAYGPGEREKLDLFLPQGVEGAPVAMFIHGGYWQALDRSWVSHCARGLLLNGIAVAIPSYDLCPGIPMAGIVAQMQAASGMLHRHTGRPLLACGHSAGGHLSAMLHATDWPGVDAALPAGLVGASVPISGLFELEPLLPTTIARALRLSPDEARRLSPRSLAAPEGPMHAVVGAAESAEFNRQTQDFARAWGGTAEALPGLNHFTVLDPLTDPAHPLVRRIAAMAAATCAPAGLRA